MVEKGEKYEENGGGDESETLNPDLEIDVEEVDASLQDKLKTLRHKLSKCEDEKRIHLEELQRARADFLNGKRRFEDQLVRDRERATDKILFDLLTLVDSFDTAMIDRKLWETIDERWRTGVEGIHAKLLAILKSNNVVPTDPLGQKFNPSEHEAVSSIQVTEESKIDTVVTVLQKGFIRNENIIRPAKVIVGTK